MRLRHLAWSLSLWSLIPVWGCDANDERRVIVIDGSSTVHQLVDVAADDLADEVDARLALGVAGTSGGFRRLCSGAVDIAGASRPIRRSETEACAENGIELLEIPVAYDGIAVVVHPSNHWAGHLTVEELKRLWEPEAEHRVRRWSDIRSYWPDEEIHLVGPGEDSGTFDYFTQVVVGERGSSRTDYAASEDDGTLVRRVSRDPRALGYFGFAYYVKNQSRLKLVGVDDGEADNGDGPIRPSPTTVADSTYQPLSRPLFLYVRKAAAERPEVVAFVDGMLDESQELVPAAGYFTLRPEAYALVRARWRDRLAGSVFVDARPGEAITVEDWLRSHETPTTARVD